jgi:hypothetical protein
MYMTWITIRTLTRTKPFKIFSRYDTIFLNSVLQQKLLVKNMIVEITTIVAGLILASGLLPNIIAVGKSLEKVAKWLGRFQTIIGVIAIVAGILYFGLQGIVAIVAGFFLIMGILPSIPAVGKDLAKVVKWLGGFQTIVGVIAMAIGIWGLL